MKARGRVEMIRTRNGILNSRSDDLPIRPRKEGMITTISIQSIFQQNATRHSSQTFFGGDCEEINAFQIEPSLYNGVARNIKLKKQTTACGLVVKARQETLENTSSTHQNIVRACRWQVDAGKEMYTKRSVIIKASYPKIQLVAVSWRMSKPPKTPKCAKPNAVSMLNRNFFIISRDAEK